MLSFVYDIADLYKTDTTIPVAFQVSAEGEQQIESRVRYACRDIFHRERILPRIMDDIEQVFSVALAVDDPAAETMDANDSIPADWWDPVEGSVAGGRNVADQGEEERDR
jgi:CRISP-associated protein Cas1